MTAQLQVPFERFAADRLLQQRKEIARAWVERISAELHVRPRRALPTDALLDAFPEVLRRVADFLCSDDELDLSADAAVVEALGALARQRQHQGHDVQELIRELHLLARILDGACLEWLDAYPGPPPPAALLRVVGRLNRAPILMGEISAGAFLELERAERDRLAEQVGAFTDVLLHELKTPLHAAETAAFVLESDDMVPTSHERRRFAALIQRNLRRASTLIGDVRGLALAGEGAPDDGRWLPVGQVLGAVLAEVAELAARAGVEVEVAEPVPDLRVDASRLELILLNLIANATKYSDPSEGFRWVRVRFLCDGEGGWGFTVSDNGLGIPPEHQARVFERSFRAHPDRADGTGLGLAIVREAVRQLGGTIHFESEPGRGTIFHVSFPPREQEEAE